MTNLDNILKNILGMEAFLCLPFLVSRKNVSARTAFSEFQRADAWNSCQSGKGNDEETVGGAAKKK